MKHLLSIFLVTMSFALVTQSNAAGYMKFDGIVGECLDREHQGWIDILSFNQGLSKDASQNGKGRRHRGKATLKDLVVVKELDRSSPLIAEAVFNGKVFPKVEIHPTTSLKNGDGTDMPVTYFVYELTNVQVVNYDIAGSGQSESVPVDQFSLNFEEIKVTYLPVKDPSAEVSGYSAEK
jgi:type VI secretion system secreted protein Hcp